MLSDDEMLARMAKGWRGGLGDGTKCGHGSTMESTRNVRAWLPQMCEKHGIHTVNDAGAGDLHWIRDVRWEVSYRAFDLYPRHPSVKYADITTEDLPEADAVLCRFVLNHLVDGEDHERVQMALERFRRMHRFIFATNFDPKAGSREFVRLWLNSWLGDPIESCPDGHEPGCRLELWQL